MLLLVVLDLHRFQVDLHVLQVDYRGVVFEGILQVTLSHTNNEAVQVRDGFKLQAVCVFDEVRPVRLVELGQATLWLRVVHALRVVRFFDLTLNNGVNKFTLCLCNFIESLERNFPRTSDLEATNLSFFKLLVEVSDDLASDDLGRILLRSVRAQLLDVAQHETTHLRSHSAFCLAFHLLLN